MGMKNRRKKKMRPAKNKWRFRGLSFLEYQESPVLLYRKFLLCWRETYLPSKAQKENEFDRVLLAFILGLRKRGEHFFNLFFFFFSFSRFVGPSMRLLMRIQVLKKK